MVVLPVEIERRNSVPWKSENDGMAMNSAPFAVPCTQNSDAAVPVRSTIWPTARSDAVDPDPHGGGNTTTVPVLRIEPRLARIPMILSAARAVRMAPFPKLSAVTTEGSADSTVVCCAVMTLPYRSAARAFKRKVSPTPSS